MMRRSGSRTCSRSHSELTMGPKVLMPKTLRRLCRDRNGRRAGACHEAGRETWSTPRGPRIGRARREVGLVALAIDVGRVGGVADHQRAAIRCIDDDALMPAR